MQENPQLQLAHDFAEYTNKNIFLTGKAGTGKTTFLHALRSSTTKRCIVVAPTGVAAINAHGVTIHSFFQMPFGPHVPNDGYNMQQTAQSAHMSKSKIDIIKTLELLVIDEISMVRADLLDGIDEALRQYRRNGKPFGGVQLLMIGDIQQLSPVVKDDEWELLRPFYDTMFFYGSRALQKTGYISIELKHIYRQRDNVFIDILNHVRDNVMDSHILEKINRRYVPDFNPGDDENYITLTTHNARAQAINIDKLNALNAKETVFTARTEGEFPEYAYPTDFSLTLKKGAQVMFVKNDTAPEKLYYNGKIGVVTKIDKAEHTVFVLCPSEKEPIAVTEQTWSNCRYKINDATKSIEEEVIGKFMQLPLKLAWAITIHKSQGLTFEHAIIDAQSSFAHGQVYVALSRCKTLEGLVLRTPLEPSSIKTDKSVLAFNKQIEENPVQNDKLAIATQEYQQELIIDLFDFSSLRRLAWTCFKMAENNANALATNIAPTLKSMTEIIRDKMADVSERFQQQLNRMCASAADIETSDEIQDRIKKGCLYFSDIFEKEIIHILQQLPVTSDNKKAQKEVSQSMENFYNEAFVKNKCLKACTNGFRLKKFLSAKAEALLDEPQMPKPKTAETNYDDIKHPILFNSLRKWRYEYAEKRNVPVFHVLTQKTLIEIVNTLPMTTDQLKLVKGIGPKKINELGSAILSEVENYCKSKQIDFKGDPNIFI